MKTEDIQWDKIEYNLMDVLRWGVGQLNAQYLTKIADAESEAEKNWWTAYYISFDHLFSMVDPTNAEEITEMQGLISNKLRELKSEA